MEFERIKDMDLVKRIITNSRLYPSCGDDFSPEAKDWVPVEHESIWYVLVKHAGKIMGLFAFFPQNSVCWDMHVCLLPCCWGENTRIAVKEVTRWIFENSGCLRVVGSVPMWNTLALRLAEDSGWKHFGVNCRSHHKNGKLYDQVLFGISKDELTWA